METNIIVAYDSRKTIGNKGRLPWKNISWDLENFKRLTTDNIIIMGRKTWESLPKLYLPNRFNIVISSSASELTTRYFFDRHALYGPLFVNNLDRAMEHAKLIIRDFGDKIVYIIGGSSIYEEALRKDLVDNMLVTLVNGEYEGDTFFPEFKEEEWEKTLIKKYVEITFFDYSKRKK